VRGASTQQVILTRYRHLYNNSEDDDDIGSHVVEDPFIDRDTEVPVKFDGEGAKKKIMKFLETAPEKSLLVDDLKPLLVSSWITDLFLFLIFIMRALTYSESSPYKRVELCFTKLHCV
jgi:hypothetical protein